MPKRNAQQRRSRARAALIESLEGRTLLSSVWENGKESSIAYDSTNDKTWVAYYDAVAKNLKVASRVGSDAWSTPEVIDNNAPGGANNDYGNYVSLTLDNNKKPGVAYYDPWNADLKFAKYNSTTGTFDAAVTVDSYRSTGGYPSLAYAGTGSNAAITYYSFTGKSLRLATLNGSTNTWTVDANPVDTDSDPNDGITEDIGRYSSLKFNPGSGRWSVAYERTGNLAPNAVTGQARYADQTSTSWSKVNVDSTTIGGGYTAMAFNGNDPAFVYYDAYNADLKYARRLLGLWTVTTVSANGSTGLYNSLWFKSGNAQIVTYRKSGTPSVLKFSDASLGLGLLWNSSVLLSGGGSEARAFEKPDGHVNYSFASVTSDPGDPNSTPPKPASTTYTLQLRTDTDAALGSSFTQANTDTSGTFSKRAFFGSATFAGKMWVFGGNTGSADLADMYSSTDGNTWTAVTLTGDAISARSGQTMLVSGSTMYIIGGSNNTDVYASTDGIAWTRQTSSASFLSGLSGYSAVALGGNLYVVGGETSAGLTNAVWKSTDGGVTWSSVTQSFPFSARRGFAATTYNSEIWLAGGITNLNINQAASDLWHSPDGATWYQVTQGTFSARSDLTLNVFDNRLWVIGGVASGTRKNDVYYSTNGMSWTSVLSSAPFAARSNHGALDYNGKLWVLAGVDGQPVTNDVWAAV